MKNKCIKCKKSLIQPVTMVFINRVFWNGLVFQRFKISKFRPKKSETSSDRVQVKKKKDTFYHGRYLKYSASLNRASYILKVQEKKYPDLPGMEYLCNRIASLLSLEVPKHYLIVFNKKQTFVTYNFMQGYQKSTLHHIYKIFT